MLVYNICQKITGKTPITSSNRCKIRPTCRTYLPLLGTITADAYPIPPLLYRQCVHALLRWHSWQQLFGCCAALLPHTSRYLNPGTILEPANARYVVPCSYWPKSTMSDYQRITQGPHHWASIFLKKCQELSHEPQIIPSMHGPWYCLNYLPSASQYSTLISNHCGLAESTTPSDLTSASASVCVGSSTSSLQKQH